MRTFTLRPGLASDREWTWQTKRACLREYVEQTWGTWDDTAQRARFKTDYIASEIRLIAVDGVEVGYISTKVHPDHLQLMNIMIRPAAQRGGLGTAVMRQLQDEATALGLPLRLQVLKVNPARRLYERLGFTLREETPTHLRLEWSPGTKRGR